MSTKSKTSIARPGSTSLRATVPEAIAIFLRLKPGDTLEWTMATSGSERAVIVNKI
jgi:bifunctional DNA-binding transcriptional regulator/antitoxin component of YhaV-PrlF toxin-antitoxin module